MKEIKYGLWEIKNDESAVMWAEIPKDLFEESEDGIIPEYEQILPYISKDMDDGKYYILRTITVNNEVIDCRALVSVCHRPHDKEPLCFTDGIEHSELQHIRTSFENAYRNYLDVEPLSLNCIDENIDNEKANEYMKKLNQAMYELTVLINMPEVFLGQSNSECIWEYFEPQNSFTALIIDLIRLRNAKADEGWSDAEYKNLLEILYSNNN